MLSIPWYFTNHLKEAPLFLGFFAAVTVGSLFWSLYAGALIDGFNRKDIYLGTNFIQGLVVMSVASLGFKQSTGDIPLDNALVLFVFAMIFFGYLIHYPNLYAFAQELSSREEYTKVTSKIEVVGQTTQIFAAAVAGVLLTGINDFTLTLGTFNISLAFEAWSMHQIFLFDAFTYFASFILIMFMEYKPSMSLFTHEEEDVWHSLLSGYHFLKKNFWLNIFGICSYSIFVIVLVEIFSLMHMYVSNHLEGNAGMLSQAELYYAGGSLLSAFLIRKLFSKVSIPLSITILTYLTAGVFLFSAFTSSALIFFLASFVKGFTNSGSRIFRVSYILRMVPPDLTGRVNSMFNVITTVFRAGFITLFMLPFFSEGHNITRAYLFLGLFAFLSAIVLTVFYPKFKALADTVK